MIEWFESLTAFQRFFAYIAIPSTLILAIQTILLVFGLAGGGGEADGDAPDTGFGDGPDGDLDGDFGDFDGDVDAGHGVHDIPDAGLRLFTVRGFIAFFTVFGWGGLALLRSGVSAGLSAILAGVMGFCSMLAMAVIFKLCMRLQSDGTMRLPNAIGQSGSVYLTIPPRREGRGKVEVLVQDQMRELDAVTDEGEALPTGCEVVVVAVSGKSTLVVCRK